jgi:threonine dehydrogenase-like Zn-dependent dehydrogenase
VLFRSRWSAISTGTELQLYNGTAPRFGSQWDEESRLLEPRDPSKPPYPAELGYETVARVEAVGAKVRGYKPGDVYWLDAPHRETHLLRAGSRTPHRRFSARIDSRHAAFYPLTRVALGAVHDARPLVGDVVAVFGAGVVGVLCAQIYLHAGVRRVYVVDQNKFRLDVAAAVGAQIIDSSDNDPVRTIKGDCGGVDSVIEASGTYAALEQALKTATVGGVVVAVSSYGNQSDGITLGHEFHRNRITLIASMTVNNCPHPEAPRWNFDRLNDEASHLIEDRKLNLDPLLVTPIPFNDAPLAYRMLTDTPYPPAKIFLDYEAM